MKTKIISHPITQAIRALRSRLGKGQEDMAKLIGCTTSGYVKWERATIPRGDWLVKILNLCPDLASFAAFGINLPATLDKPEPSESNRRTESEVTTPNKEPARGQSGRAGGRGKNLVRFDRTSR